MRTGSNQALSIRTAVVSGVQPVELSAHDAAEAERPAIVGDHAHGAVDGVFLAVECEEFLAGFSEAGVDCSLELMRVIDVQRTAAIERNVIRNVDKGVDRAQADGLQTVLQPIGRGAV